MENLFKMNFLINDEIIQKMHDAGVPLELIQRVVGQDALMAAEENLKKWSSSMGDNFVKAMRYAKGMPGESASLLKRRGTKVIIGMSKEYFYKGHIPKTTEIFDLTDRELSWDEIEFDDERYTVILIDAKE